MHPINSNNFGTNGIAIQFYNGNATITGYIIKQTSTNKFIVTDGTNVYNVILANNLSNATSLGVDSTGLNQATIIVAGANGPEHVYKIYAKKVSTLEGNQYPWSLVESFDGSSTIQSYKNATATSTNTTGTATTTNTTNTTNTTTTTAATANTNTTAYTYAANSNGGPTTLKFTLISATHDLDFVIASSTPAVASGTVATLYFSQSATVLPTTGGTTARAISDGTFTFMKPLTVPETGYLWIVLSDTSWVISQEQTYQ